MQRIAPVGPPPKHTVVSARPTAPPGAALADLMLRAYAAQTAGQLDEAERLYRAAIALKRDNFDALHMLGVTRLQRGDAEEAVRLLLAALPLLSSEHPVVYRNLGLCLGAVARRRGLIGVATDDASGNAYLDFFRHGNLPVLPATQPLVSIVVPCGAGVEHIEAAIASIGNQTYTNVELIVVDQSARVDDAEFIARALTRSQFPHQVVKGAQNDGVHAALNEGIARAGGRYVSLLDCDGIYAKDRVEKLVRILADGSARWALSNIGFIDEQGRRIGYGEQVQVNAIMLAFDQFYASRAISEALLDHADALAMGNLFFEKTLWHEIGGFEPRRRELGWTIGLAAALHAEPAYLDEPAYFQRMTAAVRLAVSATERSEALARRIACSDAMTKPFNPSLVDALRRRRAEDLSQMASGVGHRIDRQRLLRFAVELGFGPLPQG